MGFRTCTNAECPFYLVEPDKLSGQARGESSMDDELTFCKRTTSDEKIKLAEVAQSMEANKREDTLKRTSAVMAGQCINHYGSMVEGPVREF